jgi:hypothetical protein
MTWIYFRAPLEREFVRLPLRGGVSQREHLEVNPLPRPAEALLTIVKTNRITTFVRRGNQLRKPHVSNGTDT